MRLEINLQAGSLFSFKKLAQKDDKPASAPILSAAPLPSLCSQSTPSSDRAPSELADTAAALPEVKDECLNRDHVLDDDRPVSKARGRLLTDVIQKIEQRTFDRSGIPVLDGYDLSDTFIDDTDLSETLAANADDVGLRHKGFFINEGELETYKRRKPSVKRKKAVDHRSTDTKKKFRSKDKTAASIRDSDRGSDEAQLAAMTEADTRLSRSDIAQVNETILSSTTPADVHPTPPSFHEPSAMFPTSTDIVAAGSHLREDENCCRLPYLNKSESPPQLELRSIPSEIENLLQEFRLKREALGPAAFSPASAVEESLLKIQMILEQDRFAYVSKAAVAERLSLILPLTNCAILERLKSSEQKAPSPIIACREDFTRRIDEAIQALKLHVDSTGCTSSSLQIQTAFCRDEADGSRTTSSDFPWDQKCKDLLHDTFRAKQAYGKFLRQHSTSEEERKMVGSRTDMRRFYARILSCWPNGKMSTEELKLRKSEIMRETRSSSLSGLKKKRKSATKTTAPEEPLTSKKPRRDNSSSSSESHLSDSTARESVGQSAKPDLLALSKSKEDRSPSREKTSKKQRKKDKDKKSDKESRSHKKDKDKDADKETKSHKKEKDRDSEKQRSKKKEKEEKKKKHKKDKGKEPKDVDDYQIRGHSSALTDVIVAPKAASSRSLSRGQSSSSGDLDGGFKKHRFENDDAKMAKAYSEVLSSPIVSSTDIVSLLKKRTSGAGDVPAYTDVRSSPYGSPTDIVTILKSKTEPRSKQKKKASPDATPPDPTVPKKRARDSHANPSTSETNLFDKPAEGPREKARRESYPLQRSVAPIAPVGQSQSRSRNAGPVYPTEPAYSLSQPGIQPPSHSGSGGSVRYREDSHLPRDTSASIPKPSLHPALAPMSFDPSSSPRLPVDLFAFHNPSPLSAVRASSTATSASPTLHPPTSSPSTISPSRTSVPYAPVSSRATYPPRQPAVEDQFSKPSGRDQMPVPQGFPQPRLAARGSLPSLNSLDQGLYDHQHSFQSVSPPESKQYSPYSSLSPPHQYENEIPYSASYHKDMSPYPMDSPYMKQAPFFNPQYSQYSDPNAPPVQNFRKAPQSYAPYP